MIQWANCQQII